MEKTYVDLDVAPMSKRSLDHFKRLESAYFDGKDVYHHLEKYTELRGKKIPESFVEIPQPRIQTRKIVVVHYDGREVPTIYGVKYERDRTQLKDFANDLAGLVGLEENERFIFGWCSFGHCPALSGGFLSTTTTVPPENHRHYDLTAWRVPVDPTGYITVDCILGINKGAITPTLLLPASLKTDPEAYTKMMRPFISDEDVLTTWLVDASMYASQYPTSHPEHRIDRIHITVANHVRAAGVQPYASNPPFHESGSPRRLLPEWEIQGKYELQRELLRMCPPNALRGTLQFDVTQSNYQYRFEVVDACTLRLHIKSEKLHMPLKPFMQHPNAERWKTAMYISRQFVLGRRSVDVLMDALCMPDDAPCAEQPSSISIPLKRHQLQNIHKMVECEHTLFIDKMFVKLPGYGYYLNPRNDTICNTFVPQHSGGFLSDDVGLGKTLSVLGTCVANPPSTETKATLIVCPPSIIGQWAREIEMAMPPTTTIVQFYSRYKTGVDIPTLPTCYDFVLTTYTTYLQNEALHGLEWYRVVFDESHTMSDRFAALSPRSRRRWCVSATPFHNIPRQLKALGVPRSYDISITPMYYTLQPLMARHTKCQTEVDSPVLPPLREEFVPIPFETGEEVDLYAAVHTLIVDDMRLMKSKHRLLRIHAHLQALRNVCTGGTWCVHDLFHGTTVTSTLQVPDPTLVAPHDDDDVCPICMNMFDQPTVTTCNHWFCSDCIGTALSRTGSKCPMCRHPQEQHDLRLGVLYDYEPPETPIVEEPLAVVCATKVNKLMSLLRKMRHDDATSKALVFCESSSHIPFLIDAMKSDGFKCRSIHGGMNAVARGNAINAFQTKADTKVLILSMRSAAAGLNLTAANNIFFLGPPMNKASEKQAIGRAHRFGQLRPVTVHKLYIEGTVEESLLHMLQRTDRWSVDLLERVLGV